MNIFIGWSGQLSKAHASLLAEWIPNVLQATETFMSEEDIAKGTVWFEEITRELKRTSFGIVCVTAENSAKPWLNFEAGAIANRFGKPNVTSLLIDIASTDIEGPLWHFQSTEFTHDDMHRLVRDINKQLEEEQRLSDVRLEGAFETWWPKLQAKVGDVEIQQVDEEGEERDTHDLLGDVLELSRYTAARVASISTSGVSRLSRELLERRFENHLTERERKILVLFYGLDDGEPFSTDEIRKLFGISEKEVDETRREALDKLIS